ncbi:MAG: tetratricopeptide repeat protein [Gemmatimonadetes bacterium]|nr:tetratricopeptide repeat protein [Gemmatimonadota bacterium]NNL29484.1 tetratricopeptide repeat protein [Gemmatimonadota bacterium]
MKIRYGLVLAMTLGLGLVGCASGGGGSGGGGLDAILAQGEGTGEPPRETPNTEAAEQALEAASEAEENGDDAQARVHYQQALDAANAAVAEDGTNPLGHRLAGLAALGLDDYEAAGNHFDRAIELRPVYEFQLVETRENAWIDLYQEATPHVQSGDYESAVPFFENADAIYQGRPEAMLTLGQIYAQLRRHDESIENIDAALDFRESEMYSVVDSTTRAGWDEQLADLPLLKAQVLADAGRWEEAVVLYEDLSAQNPSDVELKRGLAAILMELERQDEAFAIYDEMMNMPGLSPSALFSIGVGFYQGSEYELAAQAFSRAAEVSVNDRDALEMWARSLQLGEMFTEVPAVADRWIELDPNSQNAWLILAQSANQSGDQETTQEAVQAVEALEVSVQDLQMTRIANGGASITGSLINKTLDSGASVTMRFTFYDNSGSPIGTVTESITVGEVDMAEVFQLQFDSAEQVGGYGYQMTVD